MATNNPKLACPSCGHWVSAVVPYRPPDKRGEERGTMYRRLRQCQSCKTQFVTAERVESVFRKRRAA